jgi:Rrf2 family protein
MLLSKSCIYALRASVYLAKQDKDCYITIKELSDELGISFHYLTKVLQQLKNQDILKSVQGPNGGVKLAKNAGKITFVDIVQSIDGNYDITECALGIPGCGELNPCPFNNHWAGLKVIFDELIRDASIAELAARGNTQLMFDKSGEV